VQFRALGLAGDVARINGDPVGLEMRVDRFWDGTPDPAWLSLHEYMGFEACLTTLEAALEFRGAWMYNPLKSIVLMSGEGEPFPAKEKSSRDNKKSRKSPT
jgi:hypothetical protein